MNKKKLLNDPIYGFVTIPNAQLLSLLDHPYFQRLRRIKQVGLTDYVFPGASHSRFHHALGALHLMNLAINTLKSKGVDISDEEAAAVCAAILLHDIGHAPYSHVLENTLIKVRHERISLEFMNLLNEEMGGELDLCIQIFKNQHHKKFLHQLISSQLDMDRLDYLNRDSFYTGVVEGVIGYDRIIKLLNVHHDQLVIEEKGFFSVEKFLISRHFMYWQVYLHKTVIVAEQMLVQILNRIRYLLSQGQRIHIPMAIEYFLLPPDKELVFEKDRKEILGQYALLDDSDILYMLKVNSESSDQVLNYLCKGILNRRLFKIQLSEAPFPSKLIAKLSTAIETKLNFSQNDASYLLIHDMEKNAIYESESPEILVLREDGGTIPMSRFAQNLRLENRNKYFICFPPEVRADFDERNH